MSTPKRVTAYPGWMMDLADSFESPAFKRRVVFECGSPTDALRVRNSLRGFIRAMELSGMLGDYPNFQTVRLVIDGARLQVLHVDEYLPQPKTLSTYSASLGRVE